VPYQWHGRPCGESMPPILLNKNYFKEKRYMQNGAKIFPIAWPMLVSTCMSQCLQDICLPVSSAETCSICSSFVGHCVCKRTIHAFVTSRISYCNSALASAPKKITDRLQQLAAGSQCCSVSGHRYPEIRAWSVAAVA